VNDAPVAVVDANTTDEDHAVAGNVLTNDTDVDTGDTRNVTEVNGQGANVGTQISLASGALLAVSADGSYTYDPNSMFEHLGAGETATDSFTYETSDAQGEPSNMATVTLTIEGMNDAPVAGNDSHTTGVNAAVDGNVLANDTDVDLGDTLLVSAVNGDSDNVDKQIELGSGALLTLNADGSYTYDPNGKFDFLGAGETATDIFTYAASDPQGESSTATVTITITPPLRMAVIGVNASAVADTAAQLDDSTAFSMDAEAIVLSGPLDWSTVLASYDVVVVGSSGIGDAEQFVASQLFPALSDFVDAGGGVVTTGWFAWELSNMYRVSPTVALEADYVSPISDPNPDFVSSSDFTFSMSGTTITIVDPGHAITEGVIVEGEEDEPGYVVDAAYHEQATAVDATATLLAWGLDVNGTENPTAIAYDDVGEGRTVYIGGLYLGDPNAFGTAPLRSGSADQLLEQAVAWAGGSDEDAGGLQLTDFAADVIL
jgi:VCBS repeat-containing protein